MSLVSSLATPPTGALTAAASVAADATAVSFHAAKATPATKIVAMGAAMPAMAAALRPTLDTVTGTDDDEEAEIDADGVPKGVLDEDCVPLFDIDNEGDADGEAGKTKMKLAFRRLDSMTRPSAATTGASTIGSSTDMDQRIEPSIGDKA